MAVTDSVSHIDIFEVKNCCFSSTLAKKLFLSEISIDKFGSIKKLELTNNSLVSV